MKKFRPYSKFPEDIVGKTVRHKKLQTAQLVVQLYKTGNVVIAGEMVLQSPKSLFEDYEFLDGTPCGEEYEEVVELEHDKVYLVNHTKGGQWLPRHFCKHATGLYLFYDAGLSSKTQVYKNSITSWQQVCEYDKELAFTYNEPKEYLIKQS